MQNDLHIGAALMVVGAMIMGLCGLCTWNLWHEPSGWEVAYFGFIPIALGAWIFLAGLRRVLRSRAS